MNNITRVIIVVVLVAAIGIVVAIKQINKNKSAKESAMVNTTVSEAGSAISENISAPPAAKALPRLVDLGADKCIPCKMMAPILEELKKKYEGIFQVDFFDVWKDQSIVGKYGIRVIPTQIFYDAAGKELFRHEGFFSKEDILGKWKEFGINLGQ